MNMVMVAISMIVPMHVRRSDVRVGMPMPLGVEDRQRESNEHGRSHLEGNQALSQDAHGQPKAPEGRRGKDHLRSRRSQLLGARNVENYG